MTFHNYLTELKQIRLLLPEEEAGLWQAFHAEGNLDARRRLIEQYQPLVFKVAAHWRDNETMIMDIIQEGTIGLIEAVEKYDPSRGVAFSLYAIHRIRGRILNFARQEGSLRCLSLDSPPDLEGTAALEDCLADRGESVAVQAENSFLAEQVRTALDRLPSNERLAVSGAYLEDQAPSELAAKLNVSISHVYRLQKQGVRRIRGMLSRLMQHW